MRRRDDEFLTPDLTPLIDVVFILLIFFLVSSVFKKQELALLLKLPSSQTAESFDLNKKDITIEVKKGEYAVNGKAMTLDQLTLFIKDKNPQTVVHLRSDKDTLYHNVIDVLDLLKKNNLRNINLITSK